MAHPNSVKIVEVCRVAPVPGSPDSPTSDDHQSLPLTLFDLRWLRFRPVERLYIYETSSTESLFPKLKTSLSLTLQHFVPLAGNLTWPQNSLKPILSYVQGDTVSLTIAESDAENFIHLLSNDFIEVKEYRPLVPKLDVSYERAAAMALQITLFPNRGFSIGTTMHHAILDGKTSTSFVKSWAYVCKNGSGGVSSSSISLPNQLKPFYERAVIQDHTGLGELYSSQYLNRDGPNNRSLMLLYPPHKPLPQDLIRGTFEVTRSKIQTLRERVMNTLAKKKQNEGSESSVLPHLSTFSLACAYTWICLVKAEEIKGGKTVMIFSVDCRSRLDPPIPETYFGNCIVGRVAVAETEELLGEDGLFVAVNTITEALRSLDDGIFNGSENWVTKFLDFSLYERIYSIAGSQWFGVYDTDFGWGKPKKVELVSIDKTEAVSLSDSKNGGGAVEVGLGLKKQHMETFVSIFTIANYFLVFEEV